MTKTLNISLQLQEGFLHLTSQHELPERRTNALSFKKKDKFRKGKAWPMKEIEAGTDITTLGSYGISDARPTKGR